MSDGTKHPEVTDAHREAADRVLTFIPKTGNGTSKSAQLADRIALAIAYAEQRGRKAEPSESGWIASGKTAAYEPKTLQQKLGYLVEECGETLAAAGKSIRWGLDSTNPELPAEQQETNQDWLLRELDDLERAVCLVRAALPPPPKAGE